MSIRNPKAKTIAQAVRRSFNGQHLWIEARRKSRLEQRLWYVSQAEQTQDQREYLRTRMHLLAGVSIRQAVRLDVY